MKIRTKDRIEDSNVFTDVDDPLTERQEFTIGHRVETTTVNGKQVPVLIRRVDKFAENVVVDVPVPQGENLVAIGLAEAV